MKMDTAAQFPSKLLIIHDNSYWMENNWT